MLRKSAVAMLFVVLVSIAGWMSVPLRVPPSANLALPLAAEPARKAAEASQTLLGGAYRFERGGWVYVHLEGSPREIGYQHGYLLAAEILDAFQSVKLRDTHETRRDWEFFRQAARAMLWPKIDREYQEELKGIAEGLKAQGVAMDLDDVVALNAFEELPDYYVPWYNANHS